VISNESPEDFIPKMISNEKGVHNVLVYQKEICGEA